jgi:hypothetical protein
LRFRSKPLAALSIVLVLTSALSGWHAPDDDDYAAPALHHHADHDARFESSASPAASEHCAFCHWLRAFGSGAPVATHLIAADGVQFVLAHARDVRVRTTLGLAIPSRAPPLG